MPITAFQHFQEDIARTRAIVAHADPLPQATPAAQLLRSDLLRSAWMFTVGALDAYFCDAYTDIVAASIIGRFPPRLYSANEDAFKLRSRVRTSETPRLVTAPGRAAPPTIAARPRRG
jgi:hypothetical protein